MKLPTLSRDALPALAAAGALAAGALATLVLSIRYVESGATVNGEADGTITTAMLSLFIGAAGRGPAFVVCAWACTLLALGACVLAAWITVRTPGRAPHRQLVALLLAAAALLLLRVAPEAVAWAFHKPPGWDAFQALAGHCLALYLFVGAMRFLVLFPRVVDAQSVERQALSWNLAARLSQRGPTVPLHFMRGWHRALVGGWVVWAIALVPVVRAVLHPVLGDAVSPEAWGGIGTFAWMLFALGYLGFVLPFSLASIVHVYEFGTPEERRRVAVLRAVMLALVCAIVASGVVFGVLAMSLPGASGAPSAPAPPPTAAIAMFGIALAWFFLPEITVLCVALAVLLGGRLDPRVAFTRATLWTLVGMTLTAVFVAAERFAAVQLTHWLGFASDSGAMLAGALVAASFMPLRKLASRAVDALAERWIPSDDVARRERTEPAAAVADAPGDTARSASP